MIASEASTQLDSPTMSAPVLRSAINADAAVIAGIYNQYVGNGPSTLDSSSFMSIVDSRLSARSVRLASSTDSSLMSQFCKDCSVENISASPG